MLLIEKAKNRTLPKDIYKESHHVIPSSLGGTDDNNNKVSLTGREHALCHWLLLKMTAGEAHIKMSYAFQFMNSENKFQQRYHSRIITRAYERNRIEHSKIHSQIMKGKPAWNKGRKLEGKELEKQRETTRNRKIDPIKQAEGQAKRIAKVLGQKRTDETRLKMSASATGKPKGPMSEEQKLKRSTKMKGKSKPKGFGDKVAIRMKAEFSKNNPNKREDLKKICPHCAKTFGPSHYTRWHGIKCKKGIK